MSKRRGDFLPPFEVTIEKLTSGGCGVGEAPDGRSVHLRPGPPGGRFRVLPLGRERRVWNSRRLEMLEPPVGYVTPPCPEFGTCGGCALQELSLPVQRAHRVRWALESVATPLGVTLEQLQEQVLIMPARGADLPYAYRNKVELAFGHKRFLSFEALNSDSPMEGRFLGFHSPGRFDKVVDLEQCLLIGDGPNALLKTIRRTVLEQDQEPLWDTREHTGFWRHALLRHGQQTGELLVGLFTTPGSDLQAQSVAKVAAALQETALPAGERLVGVVWLETSERSDVARGTVRQVWGQAHLHERLGRLLFRLSPLAFFQTSTPGAEVLYQAVGEAVGEGHERLFDLYSGCGSIGLTLQDRARAIVGIEEVPEAVADAWENARLNGITHGQWQASKLENALEVLAGELRGAAVVVDPPRAGLHPAVTARLGGLEPARLVYVACNPASLGRDAALLAPFGWRLTRLWPIDLFPQTGHLELVGVFEKTALTVPRT